MMPGHPFQSFDVVIMEASYEGRRDRRTYEMAHPRLYYPFAEGRLFPLQ